MVETLIEGLGIRLINLVGPQGLYAIFSLLTTLSNYIYVFFVSALTKALCDFKIYSWELNTISLTF